MSRFTEYRKDLKRYEYKRDERGYCFIQEGQIVNKLGRLEDLEEQSGCPLDIRERALKQCEYEGLYFETEDTDGFIRKGMYKCILSYEGFNKKFYWATNWNAETWLDCYKKTWWLKEDKSE